MNGIKSFQNLRPNKLVQDLVNYIESELMRFTYSEEFIDILERKKNENQHTLSFCVYMTNKCSSKFYFGRENAQKGSSVIDIGVYKGSILIYTIEAKLLPTPQGTKQYPRYEYEYAYGKGGGIQRFKDGKHGVDNNNNPLVENGLIAFIKDDKFDYWLSKVNQWITETDWDSSEQLQKIYFEDIAKLQSKHLRIDKSVVYLNHYWVYV